MKAWVALLLAACGADFDPGSRVTDLRLIAVVADRPYAAPGEEVALGTLWEEPLGRPVTWAWTTCLNPDDSTVNACLLQLAAEAQAGRLPEIATGEGLDSFRWTVPGDALSSLPAEARPAAMAGVLTVACPGSLQIDPLDPARPFRCVEAGADLPFERFVVSVKRIFLRERDRNANPEIAQVTWDGEPWPENETREIVPCENDVNDVADCQGGEERLVAALPAGGAIESGTDEFDVPFTEQVVVQFFATAGTFELEGRTAETAAEGTKWVARNGDRGKDAIMWFVLRDNRGGVGWTSRQVTVRP